MSEQVEETEVEEDDAGQVTIEEAIEGEDDGDQLDGEDDGEDEAGEDETPEEAPAGPSEAEMEKALRSIETRAATFRRFVTTTAEEMGQALVPCAVCDTVIPGFIFDPRVVPLDELQLQAMRALLGIGQEPPFANDPDAHECQRCEGWGRTRTGSKVDGKRLIPCAECAGRGWVGPARDLTPEEVAALPNLADVYVAPDNEPPASEDVWGTPLGHPEFGVSPQYRDPGWQDRIDAYRNGEPAPLAV